MAIAMTAGLSWLAGIIISVVTAIVTFLAKYMSRKFAFFAILITAFITMSTAMVLGIEMIADNISASFPPILYIGLGHVMPSNFTVCLTAATAGRVVRWLYDMNVKILTMKMQA